MALSIIIPVLNEAARIENLVSYLLDQGGCALADVIVVDGGSQDATIAAAQRAGASVLSSKPGRAVQMNAGARAASGTVLYFVHADTLPPESFVSDIRDALEAGFKMGCYRYKFDSPSVWLKINAYFNRFPWLWCQGGDKTFFIEKAVFEEMGGYDEYYVIMEEYDFLRRAMRRYKLFTVPKYALVSARKYEKNGWLRVQFANALVFNLFRMGVAPVRLKRIYKSLLS